MGIGMGTNVRIFSGRSHHQFQKNQITVLDTYPIGVYSINVNIKTNTKVQAKRRINIIKGQLNGLLKMIEADDYCIDLLNQSLAIQNSIKSLDALILERHLRIHVADQFKKQKEQAIKELLKVFKRSQNNRLVTK